jgi:ABC-type transport system involved in cytochrome c biogenesis ATPase subunit
MPVQTHVSRTPIILCEIEGLQVLAGLNAVVGDEGTGKTRLLRQLCEAQAQALWLDLRLSAHDAQTPEGVWQDLQCQCPHWNDALCQALCDALGMTDHLGKQLFMLSTGTRRKVGLIALLASGAKFMCFDQPFAALDQASAAVLCDFLNDMAGDHSRAWLVADYEADSRLNWSTVISLGHS